MPFSNPLVNSFVLAVVGIVVLSICATKPKRVWTVLISISIVTSGIMVQSYSFIDEYLAACLLFGTFMYIAVSGPSPTVRDDDLDFTGKIHRFFFSLMIIYMIIQATRGMLVLNSLQKIRWVIFYLIIGLIFVVLQTRRFSIPSKRQATYVVTVSTLVYLTLYLIHGLTAQIVRGVDWAVLQSSEWGTTAYALLPVAVAMPAIIACLKDKSKAYRRTGWITLLVVIAVSLYYDSRVALLAIIGFFIVAIPIIGLKQLIKASLLFSIVLFTFFSLFWPSYRNMEFFQSDLLMSGSSLWQKEESGVSRDMDRKIHMQVALMAIQDDWKTLLFGYGFRTHGRVISPYLYDLYNEYLPDRANKITEDESTEGFTAIVVDTGALGLTLLVTNFVLVAWQVIKARNKFRFVHLSALLVLFSWLFVINMLDIILFYLAIMPSGILLQMSHSTSEEAL